MYITLETDYAVRIVSELCKTGSKLDAKTISTNTLVPLRFAVKILRKLVSLDIVRSYQGVQGGYQINKAPKEISLKTIVEAIEGTYCFSRCLAPDGECNRGASGKCCNQKAFAEITEQVNKLLESYNFEYLSQQQAAIDKGSAANEKSK
ncbi:MAG: Rrf2 family transcriptional regulator [Ruminococcus sp.]|nr:Rrf2 family transcriptional regulator [Ruminococcus sp.]MBQ9868337.1 Rrf2 family transcriptional regulator [Ruminococcus sp.]MCR5480189.1 Rrf2 family transcriptional regulator [Ruminococcus sp.]